MLFANVGNLGTKKNSGTKTPTKIHFGKGERTAGLKKGGKTNKFQSFLQNALFGKAPEGEEGMGDTRWVWRKSRLLGGVNLSPLA